MLKYMAIGFLVGGFAGWLIPIAIVFYKWLTTPGLGEEAWSFMMFGMCTIPVGMGLGIIAGAMVNYTNDL